MLKCVYYNLVQCLENEKSLSKTRREIILSVPLMGYMQTIKIIKQRRVATNF